MAETDLTVAVTGPTGTFGSGLVPLLEADERVTHVVGLARRPFDPVAHGWTKMEYRRGDVRDEAALRTAFEGADVVVHLAFAVVGGRRQSTRAVNVDGTLHAFRAAAAAGARRFVYASSVAAYGFHPDNPVGMAEAWPVRPADRLFYAREKAETEQLLHAAASRQRAPALYLLRPSIVVGPHTVGGKNPLPAPLAQLTGRLPRRLPVPVPVLTPDIPLQLVHETDVGSALLRCIVAAGPPGAYNIAGSGVLTLLDVVRELGGLPVRVPAGPTYAAMRALARLPLLPESVGWAEALSHPAIMDTALARSRLGWTPRFSGLEALREAVRGGTGASWRPGGARA